MVHREKLDLILSSDQLHNRYNAFAFNFYFSQGKRPYSQTLAVMQRQTEEILNERKIINWISIYYFNFWRTD
jgi:hypothetical protein